VKQGGKIRSFKKRWFILNDNQLFYFKKATETTTPLGIIPLENLIIKKDDKFEFAFRLEATSGSIKAVRLGKDGGPRKGNHAFYLVKASDEKERDSWMGAISTNIHRNPFYELITKRKNNDNK
jgi:cytohesin